MLIMEVMMLLEVQVIYGNVGVESFASLDEKRKSNRSLVNTFEVKHD